MAMDAGDYQTSYDQAEASETWKALDAPASDLFPWDPSSTYIRRPPFASLGKGTLSWDAILPIPCSYSATTSRPITFRQPGQFHAASETAEYLVARGENPRDLNVFASEARQWEVMVRGLFTNSSVRNLLSPGIAPGSTIHVGSGEHLPLWRAAERYANEGASVVVVAGERYGMGSSRDWAAKGVALLGARAVLASSFERIHRSNLIGMGILPLRLSPEQHPHNLLLAPGDQIVIDAEPDRISPAAPCLSRSIVHRVGATHSWPQPQSRPDSKSRYCGAAASFLTFCVASRTRRFPTETT